MAAHDDTGKSEGGETDDAGGRATGTTPPQADTSVWTRVKSIFRAPTPEEREFAAFLKQHAGFVWGLLHNHARNGPIEEMHQDVFLEAWRVKERDKVIKSPKTLLFRLTVNRIRNYKQLRCLAVDDSALPEMAPDPHDPEQEAVVTERKRLVQKTIAAMPPGPRQVFMHIEIDGMSDQEVANELKRALGTVKSQQRKARAILAEAVRAHLAAEEGEKE